MNSSLEEIAKLSGVSRSTVSRVINNHPNVKEATRQRVMAVVHHTGYHPNAAARQLATSKTLVVGLLLTNMRNDFFAPLLTGIESVVRSESYNLLVATHHANSRIGTTLPIGPHNTDGMLIFADSLSDEYLRDLHRRNFPVVLIHRTPPDDLPIPSVTVENQAATRRIVDHLIENHGRRRVLFMRGPKNQEDSVWREHGYRLSLEAHSIPFDSSLLLGGEFEREVAYQSMKEFMAVHPTLPFDSVFAGDDDSAIGCILALQEGGYQIPEDIPVVGFDDIRISEFLSPPLTTVRAPTEDVGRAAAQQLFRLLFSQPTQNVILLPTKIIIRRSCGCDS